MSKFSLIKTLDGFVLEDYAIFESAEDQFMVEAVMFDYGILKEGQIVKEGVEAFIKDARELIKHGSFPAWNKKKDKPDENGDGQIDNTDKITYFAKILAGLIYYKNKDIKQDQAAFDEIAKGATTDSHTEQNLKSMVDKNQKLTSFVDKVVANFSSANIKSQIEKYLNDLEGYYVADEKDQKK